MKLMKLFSTLSVVLLLIASCATAPVAPTIEDLIADGGEVVSIHDLIGDTGVTYVGADESWFNYLGVDGRKVVKITKTGQLKELAWRVNDSGQFCQQMFATEKEECDNIVLIRDREGMYISYDKRKNKPGSPFTIILGNSEGL